MKNLLLALMMLFAISSIAQSTHNIDFEPGGTGADWTWIMTENGSNPPLEFVANPNNGGINTSATTAKFIAKVGGNPWALCFTDGDGVFTFDATNAVVKIMVYKPTISNIGMKFEGFSGDFQILVPNTLINQWEEITFDFSAKIGSTYSLIVIIPDFTFGGRPTDNVLYFDNLQVPDGFTVPPLAEPTTVPPVPAHSAENVLSVYTEVYINIPGTNFTPNWGQSTGVTVNYNAAGNNTLKYANLNYQGTQYTNQNVSGYEYIHVDFWTPNSTLLRFFVISPGAETFYTLPITPNEWVSVDIPLTHYVPPVNLADVFQFKVDGNGTVYFDNLYFWKNPTAVGTDASLSDLKVDGTTVPGFLPTILSYSVELPIGTVTVPVVTATTNDPEAEYMVNDAAALPGTTEVVVTAADGTTIKTYSIEFTVAGVAPGSEYCEKLVYHFGIEAEVQSAIYLTIKNFDALSMIVEIESATADPVDLLIINNGSGAAISGENTSVLGKISKILSWPSNPPENVTLNVLWSKASFGGNWMLIEGEFTVPFEAGCEPAGPAPVTFRVDMNEFAGTFTNVYVSGSFNGWSGGANQLLDPETDGVYEAELLLENGSYEYKFTLDGWAVQEEFLGGEPCVITVDGYHNRALTVTGATSLPLVCWNSCYACGEAPVPKDVTFQVDLSQFGGTFSKVYVSGSFNNWCGNCNELTDANLDGVYNATLSMMDGQYEYKFTMDGWAIQEEFVPGEPCTSTIGGYTNRTLLVDQTIILPVVCWNLCDGCPTYQKGWSGISSNLILDAKMSMEEVFAPVLDDMVILLGLNGMFWPEHGINTLGEWDTYQGYKVKFEKGVIFEFTGSEPTDRTVSVNPGIVYVPVLSQEPVAVADVVMPLGDDILFMFDIASGEIYWPQGGLVPGVGGALEMLYPGFAYLTRVINPTVFDFGSTPPKSGYSSRTSYQNIEVPAWNEVSPTGSQHIISLATATLTTGDVVGAFNADGICVGKAAFNGSENMIPLVVFGDDATTKNNDGMASGEEMSFRIYRAGQEIAVTAVYDHSVANYDGFYTQNGLSIIRELKAGTTGIISQQRATFSIFPNPGNGQIFINLTKDGIYNVSVSSSQGQQVFLTTISGSQHLDLSALSKGVYFIRVSDASSVAVEKMVIR